MLEALAGYSSAYFLEEDESCARAAERLVRGGSDDVAIVEGAGSLLRHNETRDVGHVAEREIVIPQYRNTPGRGGRRTYRD